MTSSSSTIATKKRNGNNNNIFINYSEEWWHYTLANEPYTDTYFDFPIQRVYDCY